MNLIWATLGYAILSSVIPIFNIEVYLAAIATQVSPGEALPLALAAGLGQAIGKLVWYWSVVRSMELPWMQRRLASEKRQAQLATWQAGSPVVRSSPAAVTFASGLVGIPPLLVMGVAAGVVRMNVWIFFVAIVLGRGLQSWLILAGLASLFH